MNLDHVHIHASDRAATADWLHHIFGLTQEIQFSHWAKIDGGPLFLHTRDGSHGVALFQSDQSAICDHTVAFRATGQEFLAFLDRLPELKLKNRHGQTVIREDATNHVGAWSLYFVDDDGNRYELTTYDNAIIEAALPT